MPVQTRAGAGLSLAATALITLAACGGPAQDTDAETARELGRDPDKTVFDDTIQTQDRARAVEDVTLGRKRSLDQALDASEGDDAADE